jgi:DNA-binding CsgD family transcriptional regulator
MVTAIGGVGAIWANGFQPSSEIRPSGGTDMTSAISGFGNVMSSQEMTQGTNPLFQALASTLGLSASQIQQQVSSGSSLAQIASNQGVSQSTLLSAVEGALSKAGPGQSASSERLSALANKIVSQQGMPSGAPGGIGASGGPNPSSNSNPLLQALASTLGLSASQIQQQVSSGSSLAQIASNQGVSQSTLLSAVEGVLSQGPAQGLSSSQLTDMANTIVNQQGLPSGPPSSGLGGTSTNQGNSSSSSSVSTEFILLMLGATAQGAGGSASADAAYSSGSVSPTSENQYLA